MSGYDNTNSGALFDNDKKLTKNHPDFKGSCHIQTPDGEVVEYWVSGWEKISKKGAPFLSLSFQIKEDRGDREERAPARKSSLLGRRQREEDAELIPAPKKVKKSPDEELDDEVPF